MYNVSSICLSHFQMYWQPFSIAKHLSWSSTNKIQLIKTYKLVQGKLCHVLSISLLCAISVILPKTGCIQVYLKYANIGYEENRADDKKITDMKICFRTTRCFSNAFVRKICGFASVSMLVLVPLPKNVANTVLLINCHQMRVVKEMSPNEWR